MQSNNIIELKQQELGGLQINYINGWHIGSKPCPTGAGYTAWGQRTRILSANPAREPVRTEVWYEFGNRRNEAIAALLRCLPRHTFRQRNAARLRGFGEWLAKWRRRTEPRRPLQSVILKMKWGGR